MTDNKNQVCNLCGNHCSTERLRCKKGIRYYNHPMDEGRNGRNMSDNNEKNINDNNTNEVSSNEISSNEVSSSEISASEISTNEVSSNEISAHKTDNSQKEIHERHHHDGGHENHHRDKHHGGKCKRHGGFGRIGYDNDNEDELSSLLAKSSHILHYKKGGKRGQGKILKILAQHQEINQKELQDILNIESGSMSELVIKLEHKGLITRSKDETDRRMTKLMITELGLEKSKELESNDIEDSKLLYSSLSEQEQEELKILLKKLVQGFEENFESLHEKRNCLSDKGKHSNSSDFKHHHKGGKEHVGN